MMMEAVSPRSVGAMLHRMRGERASVHHILAVQIMARRLPPQVLLAMERLSSQVSKPSERLAASRGPETR